MTEEQHLKKVARLDRSIGRCSAGDYEALIEYAMLAGTHLVNVAFHRSGLRAPDNDMMHSPNLTGTEAMRASIYHGPMVSALAEIEELRWLWVRGDAPGGEAAGAWALELLDQIRWIALREIPEPSLQPLNIPKSLQGLG